MNTIEIKNYNKIIGKNNILTDINLSLNSNKTYGFKGHNGSGKSMLMRAISGIIFPTSGQVYINNINISAKKRVYENIGVLIESPGFLDNKTGYENLMILASIRDIISEVDVKKWMLKFYLDPEDKKKVKGYSLGMKQKLGIIQALMENPDILLLDEPTNALDEQSKIIFNSEILKLKNTGKLIVLSSHNHEELKNICDEIIELENGTIKNINELI